MEDLRITFIQTELYWQDPASNRAMLEEKIAEIEEETDLVVLPEMFTTGFTMDVQGLAEHPNSHTGRWLKMMAGQCGTPICGSYMVREGKDHYYNRFVWVLPDGTTYHYDKRHLFRMAGEHQVFSMGEEWLSLELKGWKIRPMVCYDLRFPVWCRNQDLAYDLLLVVANWPDARVRAWDTLLEARAIENLSYCAGLNRVGEDGRGIAYSGHSAVYSPKGETLWAAEPSKSSTETVAIPWEPLRKLREKFPAHHDADRFMLVRN